MEYVVFTDESKITASRFRSLSAFSIPKPRWATVSDALKQILEESSVTEFKWLKVKDAKYSFCAEKLANFVIENLGRHEIRIDTIIWDTHDSRHTISRRDDIANYERMFFHLLNNVMKKRPALSLWHIRPDERCGIDWDTTRDCLSRIGGKRALEETIFGRFLSHPSYVVSSFQQTSSKDEYPIQVADLFSGMSVFSRDNYAKYRKWEDLCLLPLFGGEEHIALSNREKYRFELLRKFTAKCRQKSLGVSLDTRHCLCTFNPAKPINFWHYEPQGNYDRAPTKRVRF